MYSRDDADVGAQRESTTENAPLNRLKSIARLRMAETPRSSDAMSREELLEAVRELLEKNLRMYQDDHGDDERSAAAGRRRGPSDPYIGQILHDLNGSSNDDDDDREHYYHDGSGGFVRRRSNQQHLRVPIRRKIVRHAVFATPLQSGGNAIRQAYADGPSRIEWSSPWADYFPILIKDPFQTMVNSISEIIEYGPAADICRLRAAGGGGDDVADGPDGSVRGPSRVSGGPEDTRRRSRRNVAADEEKGVLNRVKPFRPHHGTLTTTTTDSPNAYRWGGSGNPDKAVGEHNGDTGPQIKRLVVRRGGVAIAGPGGIATAGSGGTAIVGPGGTAYSTKSSAFGATPDVPAAAMARLPAGISMAGHGPHAVPQDYYAPYPALPAGGYGRSADSAAGGTAVLSADGVAYTFPVPSRGLTAAGPGQPSSAVREIELPDGAKLIATGPIVYYNPEPTKGSRKGRNASPAGKSDGSQSSS